MKKIIVVLLLFFIVSQINAQVEIKPGVRLGANFSRFTNADLDRKTDFYVGGLLGIKFVDFYALQPELIYSRQGADGYNLDFISLGINNKFTFKPGFQVMVGPTIDFKVGDNFQSDLSSDLIGFDFALVAGVGYEFKNGISIEARFKQGFVDIFGNTYNDDVNGNGNYDEVLLNQLFQVGIAYSIDFKK